MARIRPSRDCFSPRAPGYDAAVSTDDRPAWYREERDRIQHLQVVELIGIAAFLVLLLAMGAAFGPGPWLWAVLPLLVLVLAANCYTTIRRIQFGRRARTEGIAPRYEPRHMWGSVAFAAFSALLGGLSAAHQQGGTAVMGLVGAILLTINALIARRNIRQRENARSS